MYRPEEFWQWLCDFLRRVLVDPRSIPIASLGSRLAFGRLLQEASRMSPSPLRPATLLAINLLFLMVWGFAGIGKLLSGLPPWFPEKFGGTLLARFPGLTATFWILTVSEVLAFTLAAAALARMEFLRNPQAPFFLAACLVWSLFVFLQLSFGLWLTGDFTGAFQQFMYFSGTLVALNATSNAPKEKAGR
jgi:hypothetical protein